MERVVIHYEPQSRKYQRIAVPLADTGGKLSRHFGESPYFAITLLRSKDHRSENQEIVENPYTDIGKGKGIRVAEWLVAKKVDHVALVEEMKHKGPNYVFLDAGVKIHMVSAEDLSEAVAAISGEK